MKKQTIEEIGDNHIPTNIETTLLSNAFVKSNKKKIKNIQHHFSKIMQKIGLD